MPNHIPPQTGWDMSQPQTALAAFLDTLPARPQLLGLGEPTHGVQEFLDWRNRIFRVLVENHGFRSVALETDILASLRVNAFVLGGSGTLEEVMATGFSHGWGAYGGNRELVSWLREFNRDRQEADAVRFYGFDAPLESMWAASPRVNLLALHAFLSEHLPELPVDAATVEHLCGDDARWTNEAAAMDATKSIGGTESAKALRLIADDLQTLLKRETPCLNEQPDFWLANLHARTALGLLRYHANMANPAAALSRVSQMLALRDLMMAENLSAIAKRERSRGSTLVFAHNTHLQRNMGKMFLSFIRQEVQWWSAGSHVAARMGEQYAFIATTLGTGAGLPEPQPDTLEGHLGPQVTFPRLYTTRQLVAHLPATLKKRTDTSYAYLPLEPEFLHQADGLLLVSTVQGAA